MEFPAELAQLPHMLSYIRSAVKKSNIAPPILHKIELASEEILVNIIHYAYPERQESITIEAFISGDYFEIHIKDKGIYFNLLEHKSDIGCNLPISKRKIGGLGIYLVNQLMDEVKYQRTENQENHVILRIRCLHET